MHACMHACHWAWQRLMWEGAKAFFLMLLSAGNGLLFVMFWPTFSSQPAARFICAAVPALAAGHFALVGMGITADEALSKSATVSYQPVLFP